MGGVIETPPVPIYKPLRVHGRLSRIDTKGLDHCEYDGRTSDDSFSETALLYCSRDTVHDGFVGV